MLPETLWDRLVVLRSSPGAGKTSLMRLFTIDSLLWAENRLARSEPLYKELLAVGAIRDGRPCKLGIMIDLDRDYRSILDLPIDETAARRFLPAPLRYPDNARGRTSSAYPG